MVSGKEAAILGAVAVIIGAIVQLLKSNLFNNLDPKYKKALPAISLGLGVAFTVTQGLASGVPMDQLLTLVLQGLGLGAAPVVAHETLLRDNSAPPSA